MSFEELLPFADFCQGFTVVLSLVAYVPQWLMICQTKSSKDISINSWAIWLLASALASFYAYINYMFYNTGFVLLVTSVTNLVFVLITIALVFIYRTQENTSL